jgi:hypothetical protein
LCNKGLKGIEEFGNMIPCSVCNKWIHRFCAGLNNETNSWICDECSVTSKLQSIKESNSTKQRKREVLKNAVSFVDKKLDRIMLERDDIFKELIIN